MPSTFYYGDKRQIDVQVDDHWRVVDADATRAMDAEALAVRMGHILDAPLDLPPLRRMLTPSDRVVIAPDARIPGGNGVIARVIEQLLGAGIAAEQITVLRTEQDEAMEANDPRPLLRPEVAGEVTLATHHPDRRENHAFLGSTESGHAVVLDRLLVDADVVVPIGCFRGKYPRDYFGIHGCVAPRFGSREMQKRFQREAAEASPDSIADHLVGEAAEIAWLLGILLTVQVIPAARGGVLDLFAGESAAVRRHCMERYVNYWRVRIASPPELVVAMVPGAGSEQSWGNLISIIEESSRLVEQDGAVVICCEPVGNPSRLLQSLRDAEFAADLWEEDRTYVEMSDKGPRGLEGVMDRLRHEGSDDLISASQLLHARRRATVYMYGSPDSEVPESLGIIPVESIDELERLASRRPSCLCLPEAEWSEVLMDDSLRDAPG